MYILLSWTFLHSINLSGLSSPFSIGSIWNKDSSLSFSFYFSFSIISLNFFLNLSCREINLFLFKVSALSRLSVVASISIFLLF